MTHSTHAQPRRRFHRALAAFATGVFLALVGTGAAHAGWTTAGLSLKASVASGSISVTQSGYDQLNFTYTANALVSTKPVTVTNGPVPSTYTLTLGSTSSTPTALAGAITVLTWPVATAANCTASTALPGTQTVRTWANGTTLTGSLAASASVVHCVRTSMSSAVYDGGHVSAQLALTAAVGTNWKTSTTSVTVTQAVSDVTAPTAPTILTVTSTSDASATLSWTAASDNVGVVAYRVYRDGIRIGSDVTGTTFTDTGLGLGTTYSYTAEALDAAGNVSVRSSATSATTSLSPSSTRWYRVKNGGLCVTGNTTSGAAVTMQSCNDAVTTQLWQFDVVNQGDYVAKNQAAPALAWHRTSPGAVEMATRNTTDSSQQWSITLSGNGVFQFETQLNGKKTGCIFVSPYSSPPDLQTQNCSSASSQQFTLTVANG